MYLNAQRTHLSRECSDHVRRMIGQRKDSLPPLHLGLRAVLLEEGNRILIGEAIERTVEKFAVAADVVEKFLHLARIREIATALSCDVQLFSAFFIFFKQLGLVELLSR